MFDGWCSYCFRFNVDYNCVGLYFVLVILGYNGSGFKGVGMCFVGVDYIYCFLVCCGKGCIMILFFSFGFVCKFWMWLVIGEIFVKISLLGGDDF